MALVPHPTDPDKLIFKFVRPHSEADDRLFDILLDDDGQAWSEAERYLEKNRPDLYQRLLEKRK